MYLALCVMNWFQKIAPQPIPSFQQENHFYESTEKFISLISKEIRWILKFEKESVQGPQKQCSQVKNKNLENLESIGNQEKLKK